MVSKLDLIYEEAKDAEMIGLFDEEQNELNGTSYRRQYVTMVHKNGITFNANGIKFKKHIDEDFVIVAGIGIFNKDNELLMVISTSQKYKIKAGDSFMVREKNIEIKIKR